MGLPLANVSYQLICETCITCGIVFGVPTEWRSRRLEDHEMMYCPNGHRQHYLGKSEAEKLRDELERERRAKQMALDSARMESEQRQKAERKLKRVNRGVCPKCNRTFAELARHMQTKHKEACNKPPKGSKVRA